MAKELTVNVVVLDDQHNPIVLEAGNPVPAEYADQVGDHCFTKQDDESDEKPASKTPAASSKK
jgi:hypothetical protein